MAGNIIAAMPAVQTATNSETEIGLVGVIMADIMSTW